jgi:hypothetical protein
MHRGNKDEPTCQIDYFIKATALLGPMLLEKGNGVASYSTPRRASMRRLRGAMKKYWSSKKERLTSRLFRQRL